MIHPIYRGISPVGRHSVDRLSTLSVIAFLGDRKTHSRDDKFYEENGIIGYGYDLSKGISHRAARVLLEDEMRELFYFMVDNFYGFSKLSVVQQVAVLVFVRLGGQENVLKCSDVAKSLGTGDKDAIANAILASDLVLLEEALAIADAIRNDTYIKGGS